MFCNSSFHLLKLYSKVFLVFATRGGSAAVVLHFQVQIPVLTCVVVLISHSNYCCVWVIIKGIKTRTPCLES